MAGSLIGALRVSLSAETSAFEAGMKRSQRTAKQTASSIDQSFRGLGNSFGIAKSGVAGFIGALSAGTILASVKASLELAASLGETAAQLGVTTRELQTFRYAVSQNGGSIDDADKALGKFTISISKALDGSKQTREQFAKLGVSLDDLQNKAKSDLIGQIADKMKETGGAAANAAPGVALFGRNFLKLVPTLDQGSAGMNELARAAEELGIVLSDKQIQDADVTADKVDALQTVLKTQIAGAVANNASSILDLADAIAKVASQASNAIGKVRAFYEEARIAYNETQNFLSREVDSGPLGFLGIGSANRAANRAANDRDTQRIRNEQADRRFSSLFRGRPSTATAPRPLRSVAPSGGGRSGRSGGGGRSAADDAERKRLDALRDANAFDQDLRRAQLDVLRAREALATTGAERSDLALQILQSERAAFDAQLAYEVEAKERTPLQAEELQLQRDKVDHLQREKVLQDEQQRQRDDLARLADVDFELQRDALDVQAGLAETAAEQRDVQLRLLDLAYRYEKAKLNTILAEEEIGSAAWLEARARLNGLEQIQPALRQSVIAGTRGPMEDYLASLPSTAAKAQEALEHLQVEGIEGLLDSALALSEGLESAKDALLQTLKDFLLGLARMELQKGVASLFGQSGGVGGLLGSIFGGGSSSAASMGASTVQGYTGGGSLLHFDRGGGFNVMGIPGVDNNVMSLNGLPIAKVSYGERVSISNDNARDSGPSGRGITQNFNFPNSDADSFRRSQTQVARQARRTLGV